MNNTLSSMGLGIVSQDRQVNIRYIIGSTFKGWNQAKSPLNWASGGYLFRVVLNELSLIIEY